MRSRVVRWLIVIIMSGWCGDGMPASGMPSGTAPVRLTEGNWNTFNRTQIEKLLSFHRKGGPGHNPAKPPYAVFDWDNTMVFLDIEEAVLIYQLQNLRFAMTPAQMDRVLRLNVPGADFLAAYNNASGRPVNIDRIVPDIVESYTWLYCHYAGLRGTLSLIEVKQNPHYANFTTKVRYLYAAIGGTFDVSISYPWVIYLFCGLDGAQVRQLTRETVDWQLTQPIEKVTWTSPASLPGRSGVVSATWKNGLRLLPEMQDLLHAFRDAGIDTWICTASFVDVVGEMSSRPEYGYGNPSSKVIGMELARDAAGVIQPEFRRGYDQTQGSGKTRMIERLLVTKYGCGPIFVAGDSEGDADMLRDFADTRLILIIDRRPQGKGIAELARIAAANYGKDEPKVLLQGRDDSRGRFVSGRISD